MPDARFVYSHNQVFTDSTACANQPVYFTDQSASSSGNIIQWNWNFDDPLSGSDNTSILQNPVHLFSGSGHVYHVLLQVTDNVDNCRDTLRKDVPVQAPVPVAFIVPDNVCKDQETTFLADLTLMTPANIATWDWDFGDATAHSANPSSASHQYVTAGTYTAVLTVTNLLGCTNSFSKTVNVILPPVPSFSFNAAACDGLPVQFIDQSFIPTGIPGYINRWIWSWGDGTTTTVNLPASPDVTHVFPAGVFIFNVRLTVISVFGCRDSVAHQVNLIPSPTADFEILPATPSCENQVVQFADLSHANGGAAIVNWLWNFDDPASGQNNTSATPSPTHIFVSPGPYQVMLTVTNASGCMQSVTKPVTINLSPVADFTAPPACMGSTTTFTDNSLANAAAITSYHWIFGDGGTSALPSPQHTYSTYGNYNATLIIVNSNGCSQTVTKQVTVYPTPQVNYTYSAAGCVGGPVTFNDLSSIPSGFTGYINQWVWDFGDGSPRVTINFPNSPTITYTFNGTATSHVVKLIVTTTDNCTDSISKTVNSLPAPTANFSYSATTCAGQVVSFTDLSLANGGGNIQTWSWNFGDPLSGTANYSSLQNPGHTFTGPGPFSVTLTVGLTNGCNDIKTIPLTINPPPIDDFTVSVPCQGMPVNFTDQSVPNSASMVSYNWNFGDGGSSALQNPQHLYNSYGTFSVTHTVINSLGCIQSVTKVITVFPKPLANFSFSPLTCSNAPVTFTDLSSLPPGVSSTISGWIWDFGDGSGPVTIAFPANPGITHAFAGNAPSHLVTLKAITTNGCMDSIQKIVISEISPTAGFNYGIITCESQPVPFSDLSLTNGGSAISAWNWDFDDPLSGSNNNSAIPNPIHQFSTFSDYHVRLIVININGCRDTLVRTIHVNQDPVADFTVTGGCEGSPTLFTDASTPNAISVISFSWDFGDGGTSTSQSPQHTYQSYGSYGVTLTITNSNGCFRSVTKLIQVNPKPVADFHYSSPSCVGNPVHYYNASTVPSGYSSGIQTWQWDFGDGSIIPLITWPANADITHTFVGNATSHMVSLTVTTFDSCIGVITKAVSSVPTPIVDFTYSSIMCDNQPVQFTDLSVTNGGGNILNWTWTFGDPTSGTNLSHLQNPTHQFSQASPPHPAYDVKLIIENSNQCKDTVDKFLAVNERPVADFTADTVCAGSLTTFTDKSISSTGTTVVSYLWDFGDGHTSTAVNPTHQYALANTYTVTLTIANSLGCIKDTVHQVMTLEKPVSAFSFVAGNCSSDSVQFHDLSVPGNGNISSWVWDFDDGTVVPPIIFPANPDIRHKFPGGGTYNVSLTINTSANCTDQRTNPVQIGFNPIANFTTGPTPCALALLQFTDQSQPNGGAALTNWNWDFGDPASGANNTSSVQNPTHAFTAGGPFTVKFRVTNADGCFDSLVPPRVVTVKPAPVAMFSADTTCTNVPAQFTDLSTTPAGTIIAWDWHFGDPASGSNNHSTIQNPTHTYNLPGIYSVTLQVTNSDQCVRDTSLYAMVNPSPQAMFQYGAACVNAGTQFTDLSTVNNSTIQGWRWDFGDGTPAVNIQNPVHVYTSAGTFQVSLRVTTSSNCTDSLTIPVISHPAPAAAYTYIPFFCPKGKVDFQDQSTSNGSGIIQREWTFIPGYTSNIPAPSFTFPVADTTYLVSLVVTDTYGCKDTVADSVHIKPGFRFNFAFDTVCLGYKTHFHPENQAAGDSLYYVSWNFGDPASGINNTSSQYHPEHIFSGAGTYPVKMLSYNSDNCLDSVYRSVLVYAPPRPLFSYTSVHCDSTVQFRDSTQNYGSGSVVNWTWKWGDGKPPQTIPAPGPGNTIHRFDTAGIYPVTLVISNQKGCTDSIMRNVSHPGCIKAVYIVKDTLCARYRIAFYDNSWPDTLIKKWRWMWGDGTPDTTYFTHGSPIYHTFADSGHFQVKLEVQTQAGVKTITDQSSATVTIHPTPLPLFSNVPSCLHENAVFRDTSKTWGEKNIRWDWTFSPKPGDTSHLQNPGHMFDTAGIYPVTLVVMNKYGCKDSLEKPTRVYGLPAARYSNSAACQGTPTFFFDQSIQADTTLSAWRWFFGDPKSVADSSHEQNPQHKYDLAGQFSIRMIIKDRFGCMDTVDSVVRTNARPVSSFRILDNFSSRQGTIKIENLSSGADSSMWDFGNGTFSTDKNPVAVFTDDGTYIIRLISLNQFDCADTNYYEYRLFFKGLYVPNAFSPSNEKLTVRLFQPVGVNLKEYHVMVFDMGGHLMWESSRIDDKGAPVEGWDGTFNGQPMPQGNYMWKIEARFIDESPWTGSETGTGNNKTIGSVILLR
ncbi:MAG: PKD domain-containing protein [Bacteroidota bacterium]